MNPVWVTIVASALSFLAALGAQWLGGWQASRREERGREAERKELRRRERRDVYVRFVLSAETAGSVLRSSISSAEVDAALRSLREAAKRIDLEAPDLAGGPLVAVLSAAECLQGVAARNSSTAPVVVEAHTDFEQATSDLLGLMLVDLGTQSPR